MYRLDVCHAVKRLLDVSASAFRNAAKVQAEGLDRAGGVPRAVSLVLKAAADQGGLHPWSMTASAGA